jgi:DNA polymerase III subunit gamma/tau
MTQALYRKWRPQTWDDVVGQQHVIRTLRQAVAGDRVAHAYLFSGPRGTGKTSTARILAKAVNCMAEDPRLRPCDACARCQAMNRGAFLDLIEIDAASNTSVEDVRDLRERVNFSPSDGRFKVYIIDEVHMLSTAAFNALLKTLEEPPAHAIFILATTEAHKIPATVVSRCQRHEFRRLSVQEMVDQLQEVVRDEAWSAEPEALEAVARQATGSMRDAVSLLDQLGSLGEPITLQRALEMLGSAGGEAVRELADCIGRGDTARGLQLIHRAVDGGADARQFARQMVDYMRGVMLASAGNADLIEATAEGRAAMQALAAQMAPGLLLRVMRAFSQAAADNRAGWRPQLPLELALMDSTLPALGDERPPSAGGGTSIASASPKPALATGKPANSPKSQPSSALGGGNLFIGSSSPNQEVIARQTSRPVSPDSTLLPETMDAGGMTLTRVRESWERVLAGIRVHDNRTCALLSNAQLQSMDGEVLILGFPSDLMAQKAARMETVTLVQGVFAEVFGRPLRIRCVAIKPRVAEAGSPYTAGGMIDTAANELGAQIIDLP